MKYLCLVYYDESEIAEMNLDEQQHDGVLAHQDRVPGGSDFLQRRRKTQLARGTARRQFGLTA